MIILALLAFGLAVFLFIHFIIGRDHGSKEPIGALFIAMGFGALAVILAGILNDVLLPSSITEGIASKKIAYVSTSVLLLSTLGVGVIEESLKAIPLSLFIYKKRYFNELTDGIIYFGIVGLTFGIIEDITYSIQFGGGVGLMRILISPYLHASFTMLFGICLIQKKLFNKSWRLVVLGYLAAVILHATYDFFSIKGGVVGVIVMLSITISLNVLLFVLFRREQAIDEKYGKSAVGINKFCRHCGRPNPEKLLYCSYCGQLS